MSEISKARNRIINRSKVVVVSNNNGNNNNDQQQYDYQHYYQQLQIPVSNNINNNNYNNKNKRTLSSQQLLQQQQQLLAQDTFDNNISPLTVNNVNNNNNNNSKKFNISSISMKFVKHQQNQQPFQQQQYYQNSNTKYNNRNSKININNNNNNITNINNNNIQNTSTIKRNTKSPQFSRTQRINPIRHFEPNNINTLSESNSRSGLGYRLGNSNLNNNINKTRKVGSLRQNEFQMFQQGSGKVSAVKSTIQKLQISTPIYYQQQQSQYLPQQQQQYQQQYQQQQSRTQSPIRRIHQQQLQLPKKVHSQQCSLLITKQQRRRAQSPYKPRECIKSYVQQKIKLIVYPKEDEEEKEINNDIRQFVDEQFPPRLTIVYPQKSLLLREQFGVQFMPISSMYQHNYSYYNNNININNINNNSQYQKQPPKLSLITSCQPTHLQPGYFTNPYLLSAMRILAQNQSRVLRLFQNQQFNRNGVYFVRLCKDGVWRYVVVDDFVVVKKVEYQQRDEVGDKENNIDNQKSKLSNNNNNNYINNNYINNNYINTNPNNNNTKQPFQPLCLTTLPSHTTNTIQLWPFILQKAIAKIYSTYYDLSLSRRDGICPLMRLLTGYPVSKYDLIKDVRSYLVLIDSALKREHVVVLEQILPEFQYLAQLKGLSLQQSYQILQISKNNFILRNLNDPQLITRLTFDEVMMFSSLLIFRKQDNFVYVSQKLRHKIGYFSMLKVSVDCEGGTVCYWDVWQNNPAYYKNHCENKIEYEVSPFKLLIQPIHTPTLTVSSQSNQQTPTNINYQSTQQPQQIVQSGKQIMMRKGQYLISVHLCQSIKEMDFTVSYYGQKDVKIQRIKNKNGKWHERCFQG